MELIQGNKREILDQAGFWGVDKYAAQYCSLQQFFTGGVKRVVPVGPEKVSYVQHFESIENI